MIMQNGFGHSDFKKKEEVIGWEALLKNEERKCENISIESFWPERAIKEERANNI